ncbi:MAG: peptidylprolyl isomerase, partial [Porticoccaceae bacterium]|nr:peptidylprolyl isomerase [Porticoccaceae bacterium]
LAPDFAPRHVDNLRTLIKERFFDGLAVVRSQDNYVAQWGDPNAGKDNARSLGAARPALEAERYRPLKSTPLTRLNSRDPYADYVGLANGFPVGHDDKNAWLLHCYGMVGAGRNNDLNSGNGAELYAVTGHAPRHLDRNMTLIGRVLQGMEHLTTLPRGTGSLGFYENEEEYEPIIQMRLGSEIPITARTRLQVMRTDTRAYQRLLQARTYRTEPFFVEPSGRLGICNAIIPVRVVPGQGDS